MPPSKENDPQYLKVQYKDAANVDARIRLHQRFSVNKYGWHPWVFDQFDLPPRCRILELGCGPGYLWLDNLDRIPAGWEITLSDFSAGMLEGTRRNLEAQRPFQYKVIDAQSIPLESGYFDAVIANHMLYHVPDRPNAFSEIRRVLKPEGCFYASTVGEGHMREMRDLIYKFDAGLVSWGRAADSFTLENGMVQLSQQFINIKLYRYEDALEVTEVAPLVDYILSGWADPLEKRRDQFTEFVACEMEAQGSVFHITKDSGLFASS
ncbi:MAG: class I SAM-dependent methyltransferase [Anaerolineales bacterium]